MSSAGWREKQKENNSDEESAYISSDTFQLNESDTSSSTLITQSENNQNSENINPTSPSNQELASKLLNLKLNVQENIGDNAQQQINNEQIEMAQPRNAGIGPIHQAVKNLPYFDGNPKMLRQFITSLQYISESYGPESNQWILTYIPNRLKGRALMAFGGNASTYDSVENFLNAVKAEFGGIHDLDTLRMELYQVSQEDDEPISEYSIRVKDIEQRLLAAYEAQLQGEIPNPDPNKQRLLEDILEAFLHGLKNPPEYQVAVKNPRTLAEASRYAETLEKKQQFAMSHRNVVKTPITDQRKLRSPATKFQLQDDIDNDSDSSLVDNDDILSFVQLLKKMKSNANINIATTSKNNDNKKNAELEFNERNTCKYCKNIGHDLNHCQLLLQTLDQEENSLLNTKNLYPRNFNYPRNFTYQNANPNFYNNYQTRDNNFANFERNFRRNSYENSNRNSFTRNFYNPNNYAVSRNNYNNGYRNNFPRNFNYPNQSRFARENQYQNFTANNYRNEFYSRNNQNFPPRYNNYDARNNQSFANNDKQNYLNYQRRFPQESPGNSHQALSARRN